METLAFGTSFSWNSQTVAKLKAINGIELTVNMIDVTNHQSSDYYQEVKPGLIDPGEIVLDGMFDATDSNGQVAMLTDLNSRTQRAFGITFPASTGTVWSGNGYITKLKIGDAPVDNMIPFTATVKPTGKPTLTVATSTGMSGLTVSNSAVLSPAFAIGTFDYVATVLTGVSAITVTPTAADHTITVTANSASQTVTSGQASTSIALGNAGSVTVITISVVETNKAPKVYIVRIVRP